MLFNERLCLQRIQRKIILRRAEIKEFWESFYYREYWPWMSDWDFGYELSRDPTLNQLYLDAEKLCPVDELLGSPEFKLGLAN